MLIVFCRGLSVRESINRKQLRIAVNTILNRPGSKCCFLSLSLKSVPEAMSRQGDDGWFPLRNASHSSSIITDAINFSEAYKNTETHSSVVFILCVFFVSFSDRCLLWKWNQFNRCWWERNHRHSVGRGSHVFQWRAREGKGLHLQLKRGNSWPCVHKWAFSSGQEKPFYICYLCHMTADHTIDQVEAVSFWWLEYSTKIWDSEFYLSEGIEIDKEELGENI